MLHPNKGLEHKAGCLETNIRLATASIARPQLGHLGLDERMPLREEDDGWLRDLLVSYDLMSRSASQHNEWRFLFGELGGRERDLPHII
jgi:hypothetical protein